MATDATGTPTDLGIPTYNTNVDAPSGNGFNAAMDAIDALIAARSPQPVGSGVKVWDSVNSEWDDTTGTPDGTLFLRDDGTWQAPASGSTVATTVAGLGAGSSGKVGFIRAGSSPFDFLALTYDSTYSKWVSATTVIASHLSSVSSGTSGVWETLSDDGGYHPYGVFVTAGLTLQVRLMVNLQSNGVATLAAGYLALTKNVNSTSENSSADISPISGYTSASDTLLRSDWATVSTVTSADYIRFITRHWTNANNIGAFRQPTLHLRWVS